VYRTVTKVAERYPFSFYVAHVLPSEWIASWDYDALAAGAMAVKTYAWYRAQPNHGYSTGSGCADLVDSVSDQVFDPTWSNARTDLATDATLGTTLQKSGAVFLAQYWAGSKSDPCAPVTGTYAGRMSQWGTQSCALIPKAWPDIVSTFYASTSRVYTNNLFLNPYVEDPALYPWVKQTASATMTRIASGGKNGPAYLRLANAGKSWTLYQLRPYLATPTTAYHMSVALKCESANAMDCTATLKVIAGGGGITKVTRSLLVTIPKDGAWHTVTFDPAASGVVHTTLQVNVVCRYTLGIDAASITTPYDQPA
jgi:hypothetical protein